MKNTYSLLALAASVAEVSATFGFGNAPPFSCPANTDNHCVGQQSSGFTWGDLPTGPVGSYGGFNFYGFGCQSGFGKRDGLLDDRSAGQKVISGSCSQDKGSSPGFGCGSGGPSAFSVDTISIQPEFDCDLEFQYDMPDGSLCKQRSSCSSQGTSVKNSQCGGAKNVTIVYPSQPSMPKPTCSVGVQSIGFDCQPPSATVPPVNTPTYTPPQQTVQSVPWHITTRTRQTTSTVFTTVVSTVTSCGPEVANCPAHSTAVVTQTVAVTTTVCPVTETITATAESVWTTSTVAALTAPAPPQPTLACPDVVPQCLSTWLFSVGCAGTTDAACYCPDAAFIENIYTCFYAYGETDTDVTQAVLFIQGLCAPHAGSNPAIVTAASTATQFLTPSAWPTWPSAAYTTVTVEATTVVPCVSGGVTHTGSSSTITVQTTLTVPQVGFSTGDSGTIAVVPPVTIPAAQVTVPTPAGTGWGSQTAWATPYGTAGYYPSASTSGLAAVTVGAAPRATAGFGLAAAALVAAVAAL